MILEGVVIDHVDDGADHVGPVPGDAVEERLEPALGALAMGIQVGDHWGCHVPGAVSSEQ